MNEVLTVGALVASLTALGLLAALLIGKRLAASLPTSTSAAPGRKPLRYAPTGRHCWSVTVEVARLGVDDHGRIAYTVASALVPTSAAPDQLALELSRLQPDSPGAVVHATSWRFEDAGHLVLTYGALPCPLDHDDNVLHGTGILCSTDPLRPAPAGLHQHHVVAHAARHLAYLAEHDPTVSNAAGAAPDAWSALCRTVQAMPPTDHLDAHALVRRWDTRNTG